MLTGLVEQLSHNRFRCTTTYLLQKITAFTLKSGLGWRMLIRFTTFVNVDSVFFGVVTLIFKPRFLPAFYVTWVKLVLVCLCWIRDFLSRLLHPVLLTTPKSGSLIFLNLDTKTEIHVLSL